MLIRFRNVNDGRTYPTTDNSLAKYLDSRPEWKRVSVDQAPQSPDEDQQPLGELTESGSQDTPPTATSQAATRKTSQEA